MFTTGEKLDELKELFASAVKEAQEDNHRTVKKQEYEVAATKSQND